MSSFSVTAERLTILPHPNADALELAVVGGYHAVVKKGQYQSGDVAVYIPEQATVPPALQEELGLAGRLAGPAKNRVMALRLRGEISQGIVCSPTALSPEILTAALESRADLSALLGVTKWVPEVPEGFGGEVIAEPELLPWIDIENLKRYPDVFVDRESIEATEKVHGSAACFTWTEETGLLVSSKGLGSKYLALQEDDDNLYWRAAHAFDIERVCRELAATYRAHLVALYAEVYGSDVQDLSYAVATSDVGLACFDVRVATSDAPPRWLERDELTATLSAKCPLVPVLYTGPYDYAALLALTNGPETLSGTSAHLREGVVIRAVPERYSEVLNARAIAKLVGSDYLTRQNGTEYE